uniref:PrlY1 n=1 Tax=Nonomuraea spiralis TaxID=46182 RepID=L7SVV1_9ACTN|nr:PrlY1 [Nonomuraea spiralis]
MRGGRSPHTSSMSTRTGTILFAFSASTANICLGFPAVGTIFTLFLRAISGPRILISKARMPPCPVHLLQLILTDGQGPGQ